MLNFGKANDFRACAWSSAGVESSVFLLQFQPDSIPVFTCEVSVIPGECFLLDAFAPGNFNVQELLDCKIATLKVQTGSRTEKPLSHRQQGGARRLGLNPRRGVLHSLLSHRAPSYRLGPHVSSREMQCAGSVGTVLGTGGRCEGRTSPAPARWPKAAVVGCRTPTCTCQLPLLGYLGLYSLYLSPLLLQGEYQFLVRLCGRSTLLLIIYEETGQGEVTNLINLSATQLEGDVTNRPGCHLARDCLCWDCFPRIAMMTNVIDIFY